MKLGSAFSDNLTRGHTKHSRGVNESPWWAGNGRALVFATILFVAFFVISWRLFDLSLVHGREMRKLSDGNRTRELIRHAPRGILLDRTGKPLVENVPHYRLIKPCDNGVSECIAYLSRTEGEEKIQAKTLAPGEFLEVDYVRKYLYPDALAHALGYTGELSEDELDSDYYSLRNYALGDRVGRMGAEAVYNESLRGRDGKELVEVDVQGHAIRTLGRQEEVPGEDVHLAFDASLAQAVKDAFPTGEKGAVIVSKAQTGEILAMYSAPGFSPDSFAQGLGSDEYKTLIENPDLPMFNRTIGGVYPPGSTFKLVSAMAGLEEGAVNKSTIVDDNGSITIGPFVFPNWYFLQYGKTEGPVDIVKALARSNDIYFYRLGEWTGITALASWARKVGIGKPTGVELAGEVGGLMPDPAWKKQRFNTAQDKVARNDQWYVGDTYHVSIGQGYLLTTPMQVNLWTNIVANNGKKCKPTIRKLSTIKEKTDNCTQVDVSMDTIHTITEGMRRACDTGGTGWPLFNFSVIKNGSTPTPTASSSGQMGTKIAVPVACKTGTAEFGDPKNHTHAWFTAFAPIPDSYISEETKKTENYISGTPEISVTVLVEGAGEGSSVAGPVAKKIFEAWFGR